MFGKLFKHDFKGILRFGIPMLIALGAIAIIGSANTAFMTSLMARSITEELSTGYAFLSLVSMMLEFIVTMALIAVPTVIQVLLLVDYYKSTASDEAYLTFTLPVTPTQVLFSKLLNSIAWSFIMIGASAVVTLIINGVSSLATKAMIPPELAEAELSLSDVLSLGLNKGELVLFVVLLIIYMIITVVVSQLMYFMAITLSSSISRKNKALSAVGFVFLANFVYGIVNYIILIVAVVAGVFTGVATENVMLAINIAFVVMNCVSAGLGVLFFFLTRQTLTKKLNLA